MRPQGACYNPDYSSICFRVPVLPIHKRMPMDLTLACLLILLGAMISYLIDEQFAVTARISEWIDRKTGDY